MSSTFSTVEAISPQIPAAPQGKLLLLATGGTIAGSAPDPQAPQCYEAAQLSVSQLVAHSAALLDLAREGRLEAVQLAQIDSKDMSAHVWRDLAKACAQGLDRADVAGVLVLHGTDTLEETAYFLHRLLDSRCQATHKSIVLTGAMRAANVPGADGPGNVADATVVALSGQCSGVSVVMAGKVFEATTVRKAHPTDPRSFAAQVGGPMARLKDGRVEVLRAAMGSGWASEPLMDLNQLDQPWPWVEIITSTALASPRALELLLDAGVDGIVIAGTGNATLHEALSALLSGATHINGDAATNAPTTRLAQTTHGPQLQALPHGGRRVWIMRCTRLGYGVCLPMNDATQLTLSPVQARIDLMLACLFDA